MNRNDWQIIRVGDHCEVQNGFPFKSEHFSQKEGIPLIRVRSLKVQNCDIYFNGDYDKAFLVNNGDILIGMDGDFQPCLWNGNTALLNQRVCRLINFSKEVDPYFLYQTIKKPLKQIEDSTFYTTVKHLSSSKVKAIEINLPSLLEQHAISRILRATQEAIETRQRELDLERERKAALMQHLFTYGTRGEKTKQTEIGEMPKSWQPTQLGSITKIVSGGTPDRSKPEYWDGKISWVKTGEINYNTITSTEEKITEVGLENSAAKILKAGALLMAMYGQGVTRGRVAILGIDAAINQACAAITFTGDEFAEFYFYYLKHNYDRIRRLGHGANQKNLNSAMVKSIPVPKLSVEEQKEIAQILKACDSKITTLETEVECLDELFKAMLEELMTGKLSSLGLVE